MKPKTVRQTGRAESESVTAPVIPSCGRHDGPAGAGPGPLWQLRFGGHVRTAQRPESESVAAAVTEAHGSDPAVSR